MRRARLEPPQAEARPPQLALLQRAQLLPAQSPPAQALQERLLRARHLQDRLLRVRLQRAQLLPVVSKHRPRTALPLRVL